MPAPHALRHSRLVRLTQPSRLSALLFFVVASASFLRLACAASLPLARASGVGVSMVAYGPQLTHSSVLSALSQILVASDSASIAAIHAANPLVCALSYLNPNLAYYYPYYAEAQRTETAFLHAGDPAYLGVTPTSTTVQLSWLADARVKSGALQLANYQLWRRTGATGAFQLRATTAATVTSVVDSGLTAGTTYSYTLASVDSARGTVPFSDTVSVMPSATPPATIVVTGVTVTQPDSFSAVTAVTVSASQSLTALDLWFDTDRNRAFASSERTAMQKNGNDPLGRQQWKATVTTSEPKQLWGIAGHQWYVQTATGGGAMTRCPADSFHSSNPNNRIRGYDWGPWLMNLSDTTWTRILGNAARAILRTGADGIFVDAAVTSPQMLSPDASNKPRAISAYTTDMHAALAAIKAAVAPAPVIFNGVTPAASSYLDVTDGGMAEGFAAQPWQPGLAIGGIWWGYGEDAELSAQAMYNSTIINVGLGYDTPISVRLYALGSHLLVANSHTFYYYAQDVLAYYPEMDIAIGAPVQSFAHIAEALRPSGLYGRSFTGGLVLVNSSDSITFSETLPLPMASVVPNGGSISLLGGTGTLSASWVTTVTVPPKSAALLLNAWSGTVGIADPATPRESPQFTLVPNPAHESFALAAQLLRAGRVRATLFTAAGRALATLADEHVSAGHWTRTIDARAARWPAGVYLLRLETPAGIETQRLVLLAGR